jgi:hypothetical protein
MSNQQQQNPIPVQPETIIIECSARNSIRSSDNNDEWEVSIPAVELKQGDEIGVNQSFLEARGTSTEILEFSSSGLDKNNSQRIYFEYYCSDDGTNDKNKGRDWLHFGTGQTADPLSTPPKLYVPSLHETAKTYRPCKALRYDNLLTESLITANGNELQRSIGGNNYQTIKPNDIDPRIANAFSINYKEDINVAGIFNSVNTINEMNTISNLNYVGPCNTKYLSNQEKTLTFTDNILNLDALDYWEMVIDDNRVVLKTPYLKDGTNFMSNIPHGTILWINWMPKRRQMSVYAGALNHDTEYANYLEYPEISARIGSLCGHFMVSWNNQPGFFIDHGNNYLNQNEAYGYQGLPCIQTEFWRKNPDNTDISPSNNTFCPNVFDCNPHYILTESVAPNRKYVNPYTTQSKKNFLDVYNNWILTVNDPCPVNLLIRKSPYYIGSCKLEQNENIPDRLAMCPTARPNGGTQYPTRFSSTEDATLSELFPKVAENPTQDVPVYLGCYHPLNLNSEGSVYDYSTQNAKNPFNALGKENKPVLFIKHYNTLNSANPYLPLGYGGGTYQLKESLLPTSNYITMNVILESSSMKRLKSPEGNIVVLERGTVNEEWIRVTKILTITDETGAPSNTPTRMTLKIVARNINENLLLFTGSNYPTNFDPNNPAAWIITPNYTVWNYKNHLPNSKVEWWDWRECKTLSVEIPELFGENHPRGIPILKNCGFWGTNELNKEGFPSYYKNRSLYTNDLLNIYNWGFSYFLYHKRTQLFTPGVSPAELPDNDYLDITLNDGSKKFITSGRMSQNKGIWMFPLVESLKGDSNITKQSNGVNESPTLTAQVRNSSTSPNASTSRFGWYGQFNPHIPIFDMEFDFEINQTKLDPDSTALAGSGRDNVWERNFYIWTPDFYEFMGNNTPVSLQRWSNQGIDLYCGYVPLINQITLETTKDYLTPTDLSNFWTENLHKSSDITNLFDGTTVTGSRNRGILQNPLLIPIYGSWGHYNLPDKSGYLTRDYFTFGMTGGYALGSVIFIDGHKMASDWTWGGPSYNNDIIATNAKTFYIYPRNRNNLVHLWELNTNYPLPTYTIIRNTNFDGVISGKVTTGTALSYPKTTFNWLELDPVTGQPIVPKC